MMSPLVVALAGLALAGSVPARAVELVPVSGAKQPEAGGADKDGETGPSEAALRVAGWVAASHDNRSLPYAIIDKTAAALFLYDAKGKSIGKVPILIGVAVGDEATPGVGGKTLAEIGPAERTTPAGRFLARYGLAAGRQRVLWVDYATTVALHPIPPGNRKERRRQRLLSPTAEDNRITFGCINVPIGFYRKNVRPLFRKKGGIVYILPDSKPIEEVFPRLRVQPFLKSATF